ncbi:MAG: transcriptional repressor [Acetatifactor sp.]|nr:transcriptional repressor [Acetatifactor sp.]
MEEKYPKGIKWTKQRKIVYDILDMANGPMSSAEIYEEATKTAEGENFALSTIYRIMSAFEEQSLVIKTTFLGEETGLYELNRGEHTHFAICLKCHKRVPLDTCPFMHIQYGKGPKNFMITGHKLEIYGYCDKCRA